MSLLSTYTCIAVTWFESVLPATTCTRLCTRALGAGAQTVTEGLVWFSVQGVAAFAASAPTNASANTKAAHTGMVNAERSFMAFPKKTQESASGADFLFSSIPVTQMPGIQLSLAQGQWLFRDRLGREIAT